MEIVNEVGKQSLASQIVDRQPVVARGASGNSLERVILRDGRELVCKGVSPEWDWISRATGDDGRLLRMWQEGLFDAIPDRIDHAVVAVEPQPDGVGWDVFMRDVSAALIPVGGRLDRHGIRQLFAALAELHEVCRGRPIPELCSLEDRYLLLSPRTARRERDLGNFVGDVIARCWDAFVDLAPADVAEPILALAEDPAPLADQLRTREQTLIHGDVRLTNLGFSDGGVVLIDWGERTGLAPAAVEVASFMIFDATHLDASRDEVLDDFRDACGFRHDQTALELALIGGLVQLGSTFVLPLVLEGDEDSRAKATAELDWWIPRIRTAFEVWSP